MIDSQLIVAIPVLAERGFDADIFVYLGILLLSVLGGIFQKVRKGREEKGGGEKPTPRPRGRRPVPPAPMRARPAQPPVVRAPQPKPTSLFDGLMAPRPAARKVPAARPLETYTATKRRRSQEQRLPEPLLEAEAPDEVAVVVERASPRVRPELTVRNRLHYMLRDRTELQTAFVLAEILGQPMALRGDAWLK